MKQGVRPHAISLLPPAMWCTPRDTRAVGVQAAAVADFAVKDMNHFHESVRLVGLGNKHALDLKDSRVTEVVFNDMPFTHPVPRPGVHPCSGGFMSFYALYVHVFPVAPAS